MHTCPPDAAGFFVRILRQSNYSEWEHIKSAHKTSLLLTITVEYDKININLEDNRRTRTRRMEQVINDRNVVNY